MRTIPQRTALELSATEATILGLLVPGEQSGYDLLKRIESSVGYIWSPAKSQLYAVLPRLVSAGLTRRRVIRQSRRPDKQLYRLTAAGRSPLTAGRSAFRRWLADSEPRTEDELLLKVFFGRSLPGAVLVAQLEAYRARQEERLQEYLAIERDIAGDPERSHGYLTLRYGIALQQTRLRWLDEALAEVGR